MANKNYRRMIRQFTTELDKLRLIAAALQHREATEGVWDDEDCSLGAVSLCIEDAVSDICDALTMAKPSRPNIEDVVAKNNGSIEDWSDETGSVAQSLLRKTAQHLYLLEEHQLEKAAASIIRIQRLSLTMI